MTCACHEFEGEFRMPGPHGTTYVVCRVAGCEVCDTPVGVRIYRLDEQAAREWLDDEPALAFEQWDETNGVATLPVVAPEHVSAVILRWRPAPGEGVALDVDDLVEVYTMAEIVREAATLSWVQTEAAALAEQTLDRRAPDRQTTMVFK